MSLRLFASLGLVILAFSPMVASNQSAMAQSGGTRHVNFEGVSFTYDASLAGGVEGKLVPETIEGGDIAWWMAMPQHIEFTFNDFHGSSDKALTQVIYVFPVLSDYRYLMPDVSHDNWLPSIEQLKTLLAKQPDLLTHLTTSPPDRAWLPYLPPINAVINPIGKLGYFSFRNGTGVRYLAQGSQDVSPPDRNNTFYTFQGLTKEGNFYVAAFFPAFPKDMPPIEPPKLTPQVTDLRGYYLDLISRFDAVSNDAYTPNLDLLDKMIWSLRVEPTELGLLPGMPRTGASDQAESAVGAVGLVVLSASFLIGGLLLLRKKRRA